MAVNEDDRKSKHHYHQQNCAMPHVHTYLLEADVADDHQHIIVGVSGPARERGRTHIHRIHGRTSFISEENGEGHWHTEDIMTGPAIEMPEGTHVHYFEGVTSKDCGHCHSFSGATGLGPSTFCPDDEEDEDDFCDDYHSTDDCEEVEDECDIPIKPMPKYKFGKRLDEKK